MSHILRKCKARRSHLAVAALLALFTAASCTRSHNVAEYAGQKTFASPEEAGKALLAAATSGDERALAGIFGRDSNSVLLTGDAATDKARLNDFVSAYNQMHRWREIRAGGEVLQVGAENYPFPIPLSRSDSGRWYFDTGAGKDEILARRIGKNELTAMDASAALAGAEHQYYHQAHTGQNVKQYAQKFVSDPGTQDGLYWPAAKGQPPSPLSRLGDFATAQSSANGGSNPQFNGYYYRILSKGDSGRGVKDYVSDGKMTGGFAILAYPAEYRNSGIMSFLVGPDGTVYQKDLGERTGELATAITEYQPADGWTPAITHAASASRENP